jgi:hypothetical protein
MDTPPKPTPDDARDETQTVGAVPASSHDPDPLADAPTVESRKLTDMLRKAMVAGLGAVFMTEEGIRTYVKDMKLPKDVMGYVVGQAGRSKDELFRVIGEELRRFFESEAMRREFAKLVSNMTIEINAEIRLRPDGQKPEIKLNAATARPNKSKKKG